VSVRFSPYLLAVALAPILLETSTPLSCGDTTLTELELVVQDENRIAGFDPSQRSYNVALPSETDTARQPRSGRSVGSFGSAERHPPRRDQRACIKVDEAARPVLFAVFSE
jgi:hypothetical protein